MRRGPLQRPPPATQARNLGTADASPSADPVLPPSPLPVSESPFPFRFPNSPRFYLPPCRRHRPEAKAPPFPSRTPRPPLTPTAVGVCPSAPHPSRLVLPRDKGPDPDGPRGPGRAPSRLAVAARPVSVCPSSLPVPGAGPSALCQEKPRLFAPGDLAWNTSAERAGPTPLSFLCRPPRFSRPPPPQL